MAVELVVRASSPRSRVLHVAAHACGGVHKGSVAVCSLSDTAAAAVGATELPVLISQAEKVTDVIEALRLIAKNSGVENVVLSSESADLDSQWMAACDAAGYDLSSDVNKIQELNEHLRLRTFIAHSWHWTLSDLVVFASMISYMEAAEPAALQSLKPLVRWFDFMQNQEGLKQHIAEAHKGNLIPVIAKVEGVKVEKKAEGGKGAKSGDKKGDTAAAKDKKGVSSPAAADERPLGDPTRLELRVGRIIDVWDHTGADSLYCEKIDIGEDEPRQIASGLRKFIPIERMKGARVIVFANLKEKPLRGFPSHGMVLCASNSDHTVVEFIVPPEGAAIGELVTFEGLTGSPDGELGTKKKDPLPHILPELRTAEDLTAVYKSHRLMTSAGPLMASTLKNAHLS